MHALPLEPRSWILGIGPSTFTSPWREWLIKRIGGLLPVWRGGVASTARRVRPGRPLGRRGLRPDARGDREWPAGALGPMPAAGR